MQMVDNRLLMLIFSEICHANASLTHVGVLALVALTDFASKNNVEIIAGFLQNHCRIFADVSDFNCQGCHKSVASFAVEIRCCT